MAQIGLKAVESDDKIEDKGIATKGRPSIIREGLKISGNIRSKSKIEVEISYSISLVRSGLLT